MPTPISQAQGRVPVSVVHMQGRVNLGNAVEFQQAVEDAYMNGAADIVLDMSALESITSAGLGGIISVAKLLAAPGEQQAAVKSQHLKIAAPNENVLHVLQIAGFDLLLEIHPTLQAAVDSF